MEENPSFRTEQKKKFIMLAYGEELVRSFFQLFSKESLELKFPNGFALINLSKSNSEESQDYIVEQDEPDLNIISAWYQFQVFIVDGHISTEQTTQIQNTFNDTFSGIINLLGPSNTSYSNIGEPMRILAEKQYRHQTLISMDTEQQISGSHQYDDEYKQRVLQYLENIIGIFGQIILETKDEIVDQLTLESNFPKVLNPYTIVLFNKDQEKKDIKKITALIDTMIEQSNEIEQLEGDFGKQIWDKFKQLPSTKGQESGAGGGEGEPEGEGEEEQPGEGVEKGRGKFIAIGVIGVVVLGLLWLLVMQSRGRAMIKKD